MPLKKCAATDNRFFLREVNPGDASVRQDSNESCSQSLSSSAATELTARSDRQQNLSILDNGTDSRSVPLAFLVPIRANITTGRSSIRRLAVGLVAKGLLYTRFASLLYTELLKRTGISIRIIVRERA